MPKKLREGSKGFNGGWGERTWMAYAEEENKSEVEVEEDIPPWERREREKKMMEGEPKDLPFGVYLLFSSMVAIAAVSLVVHSIRAHSQAYVQSSC